MQTSHPIRHPARAGHPAPGAARAGYPAPGAARAGHPAPGAAGAVLDLGSNRATDPALAGAKAANLATAAAAGLPTLPGFVLSTGRADPVAGREAWALLSREGTRPLVVRSSSTVEDAGTSSMAGQFRSVLGVEGWTGFQRAVEEVLESAVRRAGPGAPPAPMAVLVQPELAPACAGVLFGVDPITGDRRRLMVEAVPGSPHALVSGTVTAARYVVTRRGRVVEAADIAVLDRRQLARLAALARRAERVFGRPQDVEWAFDAGGRLWMLQSRPVTATGHGDAAHGPVLGPGPASETFPNPLRRLEVDLWVAPLRRGVEEALRVTGAVSRRRLAASPVVTTVGGRVAVDLELLGAAPPRRSLARALDPRRPARRLVAAWRVGRLRASLPGVAAETVARVDRDLVSVPALSSLTDPRLVQLLRRLSEELVPLHVREVLAGMLLGAKDGGLAAGSVALAELAEGRAAGWPDGEIVRRRPVVLALTAPRVGAPVPLPASAAASSPAGVFADLGGREALRLRARWVQELAARAAWELGGRLVAAGRLPPGEADLVAPPGAMTGRRRAVAATGVVAAAAVAAAFALYGPQIASLLSHVRGSPTATTAFVPFPPGAQPDLHVAVAGEVGYANQGGLVAPLRRPQRLRRPHRAAGGEPERPGVRRGDDPAVTRDRVTLTRGSLGRALGQGGQAHPAGAAPRAAQRIHAGGPQPRPPARSAAVAQHVGPRAGGDGLDLAAAASRAGTYGRGPGAILLVHGSSLLRPTSPRPGLKGGSRSDFRLYPPFPAFLSVDGTRRREHR